MKKIRKAIIPAAGYGTRFLPATKAQPKEMLPIVDKPIIQYIVEDAVSAGIEDIIIVTGWHKRAIEDHFDYPFELEKHLEAGGKDEELESIRSVADMANFYYLRQRGVRGNGTPVLNARDLIGDEPFLLLSGDDVMDGTPTRCQQLVEAYEKTGVSVIATLKKNSPEDYKRYGFAEGEADPDGLVKITKILEKPGAGNTNSEQASMLSGVFTPDIFESLEAARKEFVDSGAKGEFVLWDGINKFIANGGTVRALEIKNNKYYDCGNKLEYLKAVIEFGLKHDDLKADFEEYLKNLKF